MESKTRLLDRRWLWPFPLLALQNDERKQKSGETVRVGLIGQKQTFEQYR